MRKINKGLYLTAFLALLAVLCSCQNGAQSETPIPESGVLTITFDFEKQSGYASNQFAVWIEDSNGNYINTLYATRFTVNGGYKNRSDSIPTWVAKSGLASMPKSEVDAITVATPKAGTLTYTWDLTSADGSAVPNGTYRFCIEGSLRWKNHVLYSGVIDIGDVSATAEATAETYYEASDDQAALTSDAPENAMLGNVTARFTPVDD